MWESVRMRVAVLLLAILAMGAGAFAKDDKPPAQKPAVAVVRDVALLAAAKYRMVQAWESRWTETSEFGPGGVAPETKASSGSNRLTFSVVVGPAAGASDGAKEIAVTVVRVEMKTDEDGKALAYDSKGPVEKQAETLHRQFHYLLGRTARVSAAAFSDGQGFSGLDAAWDQFAQEHPDMGRHAQVNRQNYGDARLDRMFLQGLDVLFGADAGRAKGKTREFRAGEEFAVTLERPGIWMKPTPVENRCKVLSAGPGEVSLNVEWHVNGLKPEVQESGAFNVRGGDVRLVSTMTFLAQGGLLTRLVETVERTDQTAPGPKPGVVQWTRKATDRKEFTLARE